MKRIPQLRRCGARFVSITGEASSCLRNNAGDLLATLSRERLYGKIGTFSVEESVRVLDALFGCLFARRSGPAPKKGAPRLESPAAEPRAETREAPVPSRSSERRRRNRTARRSGPAPERGAL